MRGCLQGTAAMMVATVLSNGKVVCVLVFFVRDEVEFMIYFFRVDSAKKCPQCPYKNVKRLGDGQCDRDLETRDCCFDFGDCSCPSCVANPVSQQDLLFLDFFPLVSLRFHSGRNWELTRSKSMTENAIHKCFSASVASMVKIARQVLLPSAPPVPFTISPNSKMANALTT